MPGLYETLSHKHTTNIKGRCGANAPNIKLKINKLIIVNTRVITPVFVLAPPVFLSVPRVVFVLSSLLSYSSIVSGELLLHAKFQSFCFFQASFF